MRFFIIRILLLTTIYGFFGCGLREPAPEQTSPGYTQPEYAVFENQPAKTAVRFTAITDTAGIDFKHETGAFGRKWMPETSGSGGGFLDYDNDGRPDLFLVNACYWPGYEKSATAPTQKLYRNLGNGQFQDKTTDLGLDITLYGMGCAFADYDSDGDTDIYITAVGDNKLFRNQGNRFTDVTSAFEITGNSDDPAATPAWSTSAAWVDVDRDGWLDLFVCNYVKWTPETDLFTTLDGKTKSYATPEQYQGESCRLYRNLKGQRFEDVTLASNLYNPEGKSLGVAIADFNDDGWPDIVVANDTQPNYLYINNGNGTFTDLAVQAGIAYDEYGRTRAGMGVDVADVTNSGRLSIAIGNFAREPISLFTQIHAGLFQDFAGQARLNKASLLRLSFGVLFQDLDLDGYADLFVGNGHIEPEINRVQPDITFAQPPQLFLNKGNGQFVETNDQLGETFNLPIVARGVAAADIDDDGDPDLMITVNSGSPKLLRNDGASEFSRWLKIRLVGESPNLHAIGARVTVWCGHFRQTKMVRTGSSYLSQSYVNELIFGLGAYGRADSLEIRWPTSNETIKLGQAAAGNTYIVYERKPELLQARQHFNKNIDLATLRIE